MSSSASRRPDSRFSSSKSSPTGLVEQFCFRIHEVIERMIISTFRRPMYDVIKYMWTLDEFKQKVSKSIFYDAIT